MYTERTSVEPRSRVWLRDAELQTLVPAQKGGVQHWQQVLAEYRESRGSHMVQSITSSNFQKEVIESEIPVLIDFYADWCGPCKMMAPIIDALATDYAGRCKIAKCNIDAEMELSQRYNIMSIPTFVTFKDGQHVETIVGSLPKKGLAEKIDNLIG